ncbi:MAG: hypothetical protein KKH60_02340, partial [Proteobacteria bacterium]|nr:hypothetical protein [Pseudomonadota bacterium]
LLTNTSNILAAENTDTNRCSGITLEKAAIILGVSIDDIQISSSDLMISPDDLKKNIYKIHPYSCAVRSKSNFLKIINYVTYVHNNPDKARTEFNKIRKGFESISTVDVLADIGDEAFWAGDNRFERMIAIKGDVVIDVLSPKDFDLQKQIIQQVLNNF